MLPIKNSISISTTLIFLISILISSCSYEPTDTNYVDVDPDFEPAIMNFYVEPDADTLIVDYDIKFRYNSGEENKPDWVRFFLDSNQVFESSDHSDYFNLRKENFNDGEFHEVMMIALKGSGTESLADIMGLEGTAYVRKWQVQYNDNLKIPQITNIYEENGSLRIEWEQCDNPMFRDYRLHRYFPNYPGEFATVSSRGVTFTFDDDYLFGRAKYTLVTTLVDGHELESSAYEFNGPPPRFRIANNGTNKLDLTWEKTKFHANFGAVEVRIRDKNHDYKVIFRTTDINQTNGQINNGTFTWETKYYFLMLPKNIPSNFDDNDLIESFAQDTAVPYGSVEGPYGIKLTPPGRYAYCFSNKKLYKIDAVDDLLADSIDLNYKSAKNPYVSPKGKYLSAVVDNQIFLMQPDLWPNYEMIDPVSLGDDSLKYFEHVCFSDNKIAALASQYRHQTLVYDFNTNRPICKITHNNGRLHNRPVRALISTHGNYLYADDGFYNVYSIGQGYANEIYSRDYKENYPGDNPFAEFHAEENNILFLLNNNRLHRLNCSNGGLNQALSSHMPRAYDIDFDNDLVLSGDDENLQIINMTRGQIEFSTPAPTVYYPPFFFSNYLIWAGDEHKIKVIKD